MNTNHLSARAITYGTILKSFKTSTLQHLCQEREIRTNSNDPFVLILLLQEDLDLNDPYMQDLGDAPQTYFPEKDDVFLEESTPRSSSYYWYNGEKWLFVETIANYQRGDIVKGMTHMYTYGERYYYRTVI